MRHFENEKGDFVTLCFFALMDECLPLQIRYMNAAGLERKMDIRKYARKWEEKARSVGGLHSYLSQVQQSDGTAGVGGASASGGVKREPTEEDEVAEDSKPPPHKRQKPGSE